MILTSAFTFLWEPRFWSLLRYLFLWVRWNWWTDHFGFFLQLEEERKRLQSRGVALWHSCCRSEAPRLLKFQQWRIVKHLPTSGSTKVHSFSVFFCCAACARAITVLQRLIVPILRISFARVWAPAARQWLRWPQPACYCEWELYWSIKVLIQCGDFTAYGRQEWWFNKSLRRYFCTLVLEVIWEVCILNLINWLAPW
jgi:hypothetical protein